jgi:3-isopropylmalate dehydrogenase
LATCLASDAILLGAIGGPKWSSPQAKVRPESGLLRLRQELGVYANLRPVSVHPELRNASSLKPEIIDGVDLIFVRELTGGIYFGAKTRDAHQATDLCTYTAPEIERIVRVAARLPAPGAGACCRSINPMSWKPRACGARCASA